MNNRSLSTLVPLIVWTSLEVLRKPQLSNSMTQQLSHYRPSQGATYNILGISRIPLIQSIQAEVTRLRIMKAMVRLNSPKSFAIDGQWTIPSGSSVLAFSSDVALNTECWSKARQETTIQPLEQFWAERFFISGKTAKKLQLNNQQPMLGEKISSTAGLEGLLMIGSEHPQRHLGLEFLSQTFAATLAILFGEFELQLCDPEAFDAATPPTGDVAYGTSRPLDAVAIRIRKHPPAR